MIFLLLLNDVLVFNEMYTFIITKTDVDITVVVVVVAVVAAFERSHELQWTS